MLINYNFMHLNNCSCDFSLGSTSSQEVESVKILQYGGKVTVWIYNYCLNVQEGCFAIALYLLLQSDSLVWLDVWSVTKEVLSSLRNMLMTLACDNRCYSLLTKSYTQYITSSQMSLNQTLHWLFSNFLLLVEFVLPEKKHAQL